MRRRRRLLRNGSNTPLDVVNPEDIHDLRMPDYEAEIPDQIDRVRRAGAQGPLRWMGVGGYGTVFCTDDGLAFKAARYTRSILAEHAQDEADWLAMANQVPFVRDHVPRLVAWYPELGVLVKECLRPRSLQSYGRFRSGRSRLRDDLFELHCAIERAMLQYGWTAPEYKEEAYLNVRGRGPVLMDAGGAFRVGSNLARRVLALYRQDGRSRMDYQLDAGRIRSELNRTIGREAGAKLLERLEGIRPGTTRI